MVVNNIHELIQIHLNIAPTLNDTRYVYCCHSVQYVV